MHTKSGSEKWMRGSGVLGGGWQAGCRAAAVAGMSSGGPFYLARSSTRRHKSRQQRQAGCVGTQPQQPFNLTGGRWCGGWQAAALLTVAAASCGGCGLLAQPLGNERREGHRGWEAHGRQRLVCRVRNGKRAHRLIRVVHLFGRDGAGATSGKVQRRQQAAAHTAAAGPPWEKHGNAKAAQAVPAHAGAPGHLAGSSTRLRK